MMCDSACFGESVMEPSQQVAEFAQQLTAVQRQLFVYLTTLMGQVADVEDLLQEVNRVIWEKYAEFQPGSNLAAWAYKIAYFEVLKYRKYKGRDRLRFNDTTLELLAQEAGPVADRECDRRQALLGCLDKLPGEDHRLITRRYLADTEVRDLARDFDRSDKAIYRALARIRTLLLECIQRTLAAEGAR